MQKSRVTTEANVFSVSAKIRNIVGTSKEENEKERSHIGLNLGQQILRLIKQMRKTKQKLNLN